MTKFGCTTCWKVENDNEITYWKDKPTCQHCYDKYLRLDK